ncbi:MAG: DHA2 family efflux MFS transporter permease subunit [Clostridia bacterium]|nr:DHA2 family efflux MFS transporter permease subunit [Clostridia bacterium]
MEQELTKRKMYIILSVMMVGAFSGSLSQSLLTSALPAIMRDFQISATLGQWLTTVYIMVLGIATSTTAYLINRFSTKKLFIAAMTLFFTGCIISIFAPIFSILIFSRILQAFGAGILMPLIQVTALNSFPPEEHGRAMGLVGFVVAFGPAIGPTLSGIIVDAFGWRSIFYILGVVSFLVIVAAFINIVNVGQRGQGKMDFISAGIYGLGFSALMLGVTYQELRGFLDIQTMASFASGFLLLYIFVKRQLGNKDPLLKIDLFKSFTFSITTILNIITYWCMMSGTIMVPIYIQSVKGLPALTSGLVLLPGSILLAVLSPVTGYLLDKYNARFVSLIGMILLLVGASTFAFFSIETSIYTASFFYALRMSGIAFLLMPLTAYGIGTLNKENVPHGTAIVISVRQMLGALGASILVAVMTAASATPEIIDMQGVNTAFGVQGVILALALIATIKYIR